MIGLGFKQSKDDIIVSGDDKEEQQLLSQHLAKEFEIIKTFQKLKDFVGIDVDHSEKDIFISQHKYVTDLLKESGKIACKPASTPIDLNLKLENVEDTVVDKEMY